VPLGVLEERLAVRELPGRHQLSIALRDGWVLGNLTPPLSLFLAMKSTATLKLPLTDYLEALAKSELL
jgi:hypothetical protein